MKRALGARQCAPWMVRVAAPLALAGAVLAEPAAARDFCAGLKQALAHSAWNFAALKLTHRRDHAKSYPARTLIPGSRGCDIREVEGALEYRCRMTRLNATSAQARAVYRRDVKRLRSCLAGFAARGHGDFAGAHEDSGAVSWELSRGLRAAAAYYIAERIVAVADGGEDDGDEETASWVVVEKRKR